MPTKNTFFLSPKAQNLVPRFLIQGIGLKLHADQPHVSKARPSIRYLASVFTPLRCQAGAIHVDPISTRRFTRSIFMKRVLPITFPDERSTVANATDSPFACSAKAFFTKCSKSSSFLIE